MDSSLKKEGISYLHNALLMFQGAEDWDAVDELNKLINKLENRFQGEESDRRHDDGD